MKKGRIMAVALPFCLLVAGCGKSDLKKNEVLEYLSYRYGGEFTCISSGDVPRGMRRALDPRMETTAETQEDANADDIVEVYEDANGVRFHAFHYLRYGFVGSWVVMEDYPVQWLLSQPELYAPLEEAGCTYYNQIGAGEDADAGFRLTVERFEDIRPAAELAFSVIGNDAAILPDKGLRTEKQEQQEDNFWTRAIIPQIVLVTEEGDALGTLQFRTLQVPQMTDRENFIRAAEQNFIDTTRKPGLLPEGAAEREFPDSIPVYAGDQQVATLRPDYWKHYRIEDSVKRGEDLRFTQVCDICEYCGYTIEAKKHKLYFRKDDDTILFSRRSGKGYDHSIYNMAKNGTFFQPEGLINDELEDDKCVLTIADLWYLFGITIDVDYDAGEAHIR